jgi:hypothetical protein
VHAFAQSILHYDDLDIYRGSCVKFTMSPNNAGALIDRTMWPWDARTGTARGKLEG